MVTPARLSRRGTRRALRSGLPGGRRARKGVRHGQARFICPFPPVVFPVLALLLAFAAAATPLPAQRDPRVQARMDELRRQGQAILVEHRYWTSVVESDDWILLPTSSGLPIVLPRAHAEALAGHWDTTDDLTGHVRHLQAHAILAEWARLTAELRAELRRTLLAELRQRYEAGRQEFYALAGTPPPAARPGLPIPTPTPTPTPTPGPRLTGWALGPMERSADPPRGNTGVVAEGGLRADGGSVTLQLDVGGGCTEQWLLSWGFSPGLGFLKAGDRVNVALTAARQGRSCGGSARIYIASPRPEAWVLAMAPENLIEGALSPLQFSATAGGEQPTATATDVLVVERDPTRTPSFVVLRVYCYVPGYHYVAAYVLQADVR